MMSKMDNNQQPLPYSLEPQDKAAFTEKNDRIYTRIAPLYEGFAKGCPFWRRWLREAIPHIQGPRVLEVSFGTGYLLTQYADSHEEVHGVEWNERLLEITRRALRDLGLEETSKRLVRGKVEDLPYPNEFFDSVIVTMAFTGYPDGHRAMAELKRVLKKEGRLIVVDVNYPDDRGNCLGTFLTNMWKAAGDIIRDMGALFDEFDLHYKDEEVGGFGSIHLYVATKK